MIESKIYDITSNLFEDYQQYCKHDHGYLGFPAQTVFCQIWGAENRIVPEHIYCYPCRISLSNICYRGLFYWFCLKRLNMKALYRDTGIL